MASRNNRFSDDMNGSFQIFAEFSNGNSKGAKNDPKTANFAFFNAIFSDVFHTNWATTFVQKAS